MACVGDGGQDVCEGLMGGLWVVVVGCRGVCVERCHMNRVLYKRQALSVSTGRRREQHG